MKYLIVFAWMFTLSITAFTQSGSPVPLELVEPAVDAARKQFPEQPQERRSFIDGYCSAFLDQFRYGSRIGDLSIGGPDKAWMLGHKVGLDASTAHLHVTPVEFGYTIETLTGIYKPHFEMSHFALKETGEKFSVHCGMAKSVPADVEITVTAFVSPERNRGFGHMNWSKKEIIIMKVEEPKPAPVATPPAMQEKSQP